MAFPPDGYDADQLRMELGKPAWWQHRVVLFSLIGVDTVLLVACFWLGSSLVTAREHLELMRERAEQGFLMPPSSERRVRVDLDAIQPVSMGGNLPERVEFALNAKRKRFNLFRISVARQDGTALVHFDRLVRDSNGELKFALNSGVMPSGDYVIRVEGLTGNGRSRELAAVPLYVQRRVISLGGG